MKNKAFTLVELLAVIVVLGLIALIVTPVLIRVMNKQSKRTFEESIHGIMRSVEIDYSDDDFNFPREYYYENGTLTLLTVGEKDRNEVVKTNGKLEGKGTIYVDEDGDIIIDGICGDDYCASKGKDDSDITIDKSDGENPVKDPLDPQITLLGEKELYLKIGSTFDDPGVTAKTYGGEELPYEREIKQGTSIVESINTNEEGSYIITYSTTSNNKTVSATRKVFVIDSKPIIIIDEPKENYVKEQKVTIEVKAVSPSTVSRFTYSINGTEEVVNGISKTITLNETGEYTVVVNVTDNNGNTNTVSKTYKIDADGPVIIIAEENKNEIVKITEIGNYNPKEGVSATDNVEAEGYPVISCIAPEMQEIGTYTVICTAEDKVGNISEEVSKIVKIVEADGPILNFSSIGTGETWIGKDANRSVTVTATDDSKLSSFTYQIIKDGTPEEVKNGTITENSGEATITFDESGIYQIKLTGSDEYGNTTGIDTEFISEEYKIDVDPPTLTFEDITIKDNEAEEYDLMTGVTVSDNHGTPSITTKGNLSKVVGEYEIEYTVTDEAGNSVTKKRKITVEKGVQTPTEIMEKDPGENGVIVTDTDGNKRFAGSNPNNWVCFGDSNIIDGTTCDDNHKWRIIGVFGGQMKIMTNYYYSGNSSWDTSGSNNWERPATLNTELNGSSFYSNNTYIDTTHRNYIADRAWYTGGESPSGTYTLQAFETGEKNRSSANRNIGLMSMTDFGYAGKNCTLTTIMNNQNNACMNNNWIFSNTSHQWSITPTSSNTKSVWYVSTDGLVDSNATGSSYGVYPATYLRKNVKITGGSGTEEDPYMVYKEPEVTDNDPGTNGNIVTDFNGNKRYAGSNPNNWVCFGSSTITNPGNCDDNHKWRIIGVMDGRMKIITNYYYSTNKIMDENARLWSNSTLKLELSGDAFYGNETYIDSTHRSYIKIGFWGGNVSYLSPMTYNYFINGEKNSGGIGVKVGLMSVTDFGYAGRGCDFSKRVDSGYPCMFNNWLWRGKSEWTMSYSTGIGSEWYVNSDNQIISSNMTNNLSIGVRPSLFLNSNVKITGGSGTSNDPYILGT